MGWNKVHSSTIGRSVEDTMTPNDTRITRNMRETAANLVKSHPRNSQNSAKRITYTGLSGRQSSWSVRRSAAEP
eukprot:3105024-Prymnesium_polylepis.2